MGLSLDVAGALLTKKVPGKAFLYDDILWAAHLRLSMTDSWEGLLWSPMGISEGKFIGGNFADMTFLLDRRC